MFLCSAWSQNATPKDCDHQKLTLRCAHSKQPKSARMARVSLHSDTAGRCTWRALHVHETINVFFRKHRMRVSRLASRCGCRQGGRAWTRKLRLSPCLRLSTIWPICPYCSMQRVYLRAAHFERHLVFCGCE